jgi:hypothetical protein
MQRSIRLPRQRFRVRDVPAEIRGQLITAGASVFRTWRCFSTTSLLHGGAAHLAKWSKRPHLGGRLLGAVRQALYGIQ